MVRIPIHDAQPTHVLDEHTMEVTRDTLLWTGVQHLAEQSVAYHDIPRWRWLERRRRKKELFGMIEILRTMTAWTP